MDAARQAGRIRAQVRGLTTRGRGRRYPLALRRQVVAYVALRRGQGVTARAVAEELELSWQTLKHWLYDRKPDGEVRRRKRPVLRPVTVAPETGAAETVGRGGFVVVGPRGFRVEGLDIAELAELLMRLA